MATTTATTGFTTRDGYRLTVSGAGELILLRPDNSEVGYPDDAAEARAWVDEDRAEKVQERLYEAVASRLVDADAATLRKVEAFLDAIGVAK